MLLFILVAFTVAAWRALHLAGKHFDDLDVRAAADAEDAFWENQS